MTQQTLYFGYGSNLWKDQMNRRCPESELKGWKWFINCRGFANIIESSEHVVHGFIYELTPQDEKELDYYERKYEKENIPPLHDKSIIATAHGPIYPLVEGNLGKQTSNAQSRVTSSNLSSMNSFRERFSTTGIVSRLRQARRLDGEEDSISDTAWGSQAGFGNLVKGSPSFVIPAVPDPTAFLRLHTDDQSDPDCKIKIQHGTTTLAFRFRGGVLVAVDSRATAGNYIASGTVKKVIEINPYLLGTMAGGAADCQYWETYLGVHCRLHELRNRERISVSAASKYLSNLVYSYKGMGLSMGTMICGWDKTGPAIFYVDSDGQRLKGDLFSVGSGSTFAYGVLDQGYRWDLTDEEAHELGLRSIYAAGHRDAFSGNTCNLFQVKADGWKFIGNYDIAKMHYEGIGLEPYGYDARFETVGAA